MSTDLLSFEHPSVLLFCFIHLSRSLFLYIIKPTKLRIYSMLNTDNFDVNFHRISLSIVVLRSRKKIYTVNGRQTDLHQQGYNLRKVPLMFNKCLLNSFGEVETVKQVVNGRQAITNLIILLKWAKQNWRIPKKSSPANRVFFSHISSYARNGSPYRCFILRAIRFHINFYGRNCLLGCFMVNMGIPSNSMLYPSPKFWTYQYTVTTSIDYLIVTLLPNYIFLPTFALLPIPEGFHI